MSDIKELLGHFDKRTKHPVFPGEDYDYFCYGHPPVEEFVDGVLLIDEILELEPKTRDTYPDLVKYVTHGYAAPLNEYTEGDEIRFNFCDKDDATAFPLTWLYL